MQALGLIETRGLLAAVESADAMLKAAEVTLLDKTYVGGGLVSIAVTGGVAAVKAAVEAGAAAVKQIDDKLLVSEHVIPRPHEEIDSLILPIQPKEDSILQSAEVSEAELVKETAEETETEENINTEISADLETSAEEKEAEELVIELPVGTILQEETTDSISLSEDDTAHESSIDTDTEIENETNVLDFNPDKINKEAIDKIVHKHGLGKALEILNKLKVTKLRNLAREYKNLRIAGRIISKADKKVLIAEFTEYYRKN